ncbi:hypothetical protein BDQ17DRAFT_1193347, partial [Cyathus striatus]
CALFNTFVLQPASGHASDEYIWRQVKFSEYWSKDIWILPIHHTQLSWYWVLCTILPHQCTLLLFDSFSDCKPWITKINV